MIDHVIEQVIDQIIDHVQLIRRSIPPQPDPWRFGERVGFHLEGFFQIRAEFDDLVRECIQIIGQPQETKDDGLGVRSDDLDAMSCMPA